MATTCYGQSAGVFHIAPGGGSCVLDAYEGEMK